MNMFFFSKSVLLRCRPGCYFIVRFWVKCTGFPKCPLSEIMSEASGGRVKLYFEIHLNDVIVHVGFSNMEFQRSFLSFGQYL